MKPKHRQARYRVTLADRYQASPQALLGVIAHLETQMAQADFPGYVRNLAQDCGHSPEEVQRTYRYLLSHYRAQLDRLAY